MKIYFDFGDLGLAYMLLTYLISNYIITFLFGRGEGERKCAPFGDFMDISAFPSITIQIKLWLNINWEIGLGEGGGIFSYNADNI